MIFYRLAYKSRHSHVLNYSFFYPNTKRCLSLEQSFLCNSSLLSSRKLNIKVEKPHKHEPSLRQPSDTIFRGTPPETRANHRSCGVLFPPQNREASLEEVLHPFNVASKAKTEIDSKKSSLRDFTKQLIRLTKPNLTILVTLSSICSYAISPNSLSIAELAFLTIGTALCSGSANAINMGREPDFDRKMSRTSTRPVVTGKVSPKQAFLFASLTGILGTLVLYAGVNTTVALLGLLNIGLYGWIYTSLKRYSIVNTWVGAIVGARPPLMGWAASTSLTHPGGWCLAALLYAWQFPHFNALSHNVADQYKGAGYVMTAAENPKLNARVALRYSILMLPICVGLSYFEVTDWVFPIDSGVANLWLTVLAYRFWRQQKLNHANKYIPSKQDLLAANIQAKLLFWCSVWQLPAVLVLAMLHKKGQWDRLWIYLGWYDEPASS